MATHFLPSKPRPPRPPSPTPPVAVASARPTSTLAQPPPPPTHTHTHHPHTHTHTPHPHPHPHPPPTHPTTTTTPPHSRRRLLLPAPIPSSASYFHPVPESASTLPPASAANAGFLAIRKRVLERASASDSKRHWATAIPSLPSTATRQRSRNLPSSPSEPPRKRRPPPDFSPWSQSFSPLNERFRTVIVSSAPPLRLGAPSRAISQPLCHLSSSRRSLPFASELTPCTTL